MNKTTTFFTKNDEKNLRLDKLLTIKLKTVTRSQIKKIIDSGDVKVNNKETVSTSQKIKAGSKIEILLKDKINEIIPSKTHLDIIYEDKDILIIDKPKGMVVHPGAGNYKNTLVNALVFKYKKNLSSINGTLRPGIVHRIDKETSGLLVIAKNNLAHVDLGNQFSKHTIKRKYLCLSWGVIRPLNGRISTLITKIKKTDN